MKKLRCILLALIVAATCFGGALAEEKLSAVGEFPIAQEKTTLTVLMQQDVLVEDYETNAFTQWIEETCNVNLDFVLLPAGADGLDKLSIMLSSGEKLPDIINVPSSTLDDYIYGQAGIYIALNDLIENDAYYIDLRMAEYPEVDLFGPVTAADGNIYALPYYMHESIGDCSKRCWVNQKFIDALGLSVPTTTDELYDVLVAIRDGDPNGNGIADEIPLLPADTANLMGYLMNAFVYCDPSNNYYTVNGGEVGVCYTTDAFREGLRYMSRLCQEGLLSPLTFTQTYDQFKQTCTNDSATEIVGFGIQFALSMMLNNYATNPFLADYSNAIAPLTGPEGVRFANYTPTLSKSQWHITKYCETPILAFRVADLLYSQEAYLRNRFGLEGENWRYVDASEQLPSYYDGRLAIIDNYNAIYMLENNVMWRNNIPCFAQDELDLRVWNRDPLQVTYTCAKSWPAYMACIPAEYILRLNFTPDESEEINEIQSTLLSYVNESIARFITGDLDIENDWDSFLSEVDSIGLSTFLSISQDAYNRSLD